MIWSGRVWVMRVHAVRKMTSQTKNTHTNVSNQIMGKTAALWNVAKRGNIIWQRATGQCKGGCPNKTRQSPVSSTNMDHKGLASTHWSFVAGAWAEHKQEKYNKLNKSENTQKTLARTCDKHKTQANPCDAFLSWCAGCHNAMDQIFRVLNLVCLCIYKEIGAKCFWNRIWAIFCQTFL